MVGDKYEIIPWFARGKRIHKTLVVAEIGNVHDGSLGDITSLIKAVAGTGADVVKLQSHVANYDSSTEFPKRFSYHPQDVTRYQYWERVSIRQHWWDEIVSVCHECKIQLMVSLFCEQALERIPLGILDNITFLKIPSGEANNKRLIEAIWKTQKITVLSTGMSDTREINAAVSELLKDPQVLDLYILQCTTKYPTLPSDVGMNVVDVFCRNLLFKGGLSDHSGTIWPSVIAAYMCAYMVEVHVCWDKRQFGADVSSSVTIDELSSLVEGVRWAEDLRSNPFSKDEYQPPEDSEVYRR